MYGFLIELELFGTGSSRGAQRCLGFCRRIIRLETGLGLAWKSPGVEFSALSGRYPTRKNKRQ